MQWEGVDWIHLAQEGTNGGDFKMVVNFRVHKKWGICWVAKRLFWCQEGYYSLELVVGWLVGWLVVFILACSDNSKHKNTSNKF